MLVDPGPSQYDVNFRLFGTPVRIHPLFWLVSVIFGWSWIDLGLPYLGIYVFCVFLSILLHEFGHIWAGKAFGSDGYIVLYSLGGLAIGSRDQRERWQRIVVSLAGPGIQLALYGILWFVLRNIDPARLIDLPKPVIIGIGMLLWINLYWPLLNLLPVWPLDGGMVARELCEGFSRRDGLRVSLLISVGVAGLIALHAFLATGERHIPYLPQGNFVGIFFALLAIESYQMLAAKPAWKYDEPDDRLPWER